MTGKNVIFFIVAASCASRAACLEVQDVAKTLSGIRDYTGTAKVELQLPQGAEVNYDLTLYSTPTENDPLSSLNYLIDWTLHTEAAGDQKGFSAYFPGNMYRYSDRRLSEYHFSYDSIPFLLGNGAVQNNAQFLGYTPQKLGEMLDEMQADPNWKVEFHTDTLFNGRKADVILGQFTTHGYVGKNLTLVLDPANSMPIYMESENNPASISEQIITVSYKSSDTASFPISEEGDLIALYPEIFSNFRESNFSLETLPGHQIPAFSLPTLTGERYTYEKGRGFAVPTIIAFIDPAIATSGETVTLLRQGIDRLPMRVNLLIVSTSSDIQGTEEATGNIRQGEEILLSGKSFARACGAVNLPSMLYVGKDGEVRDISIGYNKELPSVVIEKSIKF